MAKKKPYLVVRGGQKAEPCWGYYLSERIPGSGRGDLKMDFVTVHELDKHYLIKHNMSIDVGIRHDEYEADKLAYTHLIKIAQGLANRESMRIEDGTRTGKRIRALEKEAGKKK